MACEDIFERIGKSLTRLEDYIQMQEGTMASYRDRLRELNEENRRLGNMEVLKSLSKVEAERNDLRAENEHLRNRVAELEGQTNSYPTEYQLSPEMRARLMPEGMSWPRWDTGEPVMFGDVVNGIEVEFVRFPDAGNSAVVELLDEDAEPLLELSHGERVKRPVPLDKDGVPTKVGDTVYDRRGVDWVVRWTDGKCINLDGGRRCESVFFADLSEYTHRAPGTAGGDQFPDAKKMVDSWEKLDDDATRTSVSYVVRYDLDLPEHPDMSDYDAAMNRDLIRRAKALAGSGSDD